MIEKIRNFLDARRRLRFWEQKWNRAVYQPAWLEHGARQQVVSAFTDGWIVPGNTVLDIGCGVGNTSIWLARNGCDVVGMDFSAAAIAKARQFGTGLPLARFEVVDATQPVDLGRAFDVLLDLGCLHQLPPNALPQYRANLERWSRPGTRLLALMKTYDDSPQETLERALALLQPGFKLLSFVETDLAAVDDDRSRPGVCLRLERV